MKDKAKLLSIAAGSLALSAGALIAEQGIEEELTHCLALGAGTDVRTAFEDQSQPIDPDDCLAFWWLWDDKDPSVGDAYSSDTSDEAKCGEGNCGAHGKEPAVDDKADESMYGVPEDERVEEKDGADEGGAAEGAELNWWER